MSFPIRNYSIYLLFTLFACSPKLVVKQAQTISPEAQEYIQKNKPKTLPFIQFPEKAVIKSRLKQNAEKASTLEKTRAEYGITVKEDTIGGIPVTILFPPNTKIETATSIGFYIHGGAFMFGSSYDFTAVSMSHELGIPIISVEYQFSPTVQFPNALNESFVAYKALTTLYSDKKIIAFGISAGGNLLLSTLIKARDENLKLPVAVGLFTPFADLSGSGDSYVSNEGRDPVVVWKNQTEKVVNAYIGKDGNAKNPLISPIYADYSKGFPPSIITTGTRDLLLSDCTRLYQLFKKESIPVELSIYEGMWHAFNVTPNLPEGELCRKEVAAFLKRYLE